MLTTNLSTLNIHKLSQEQYNTAYENGNIDANAIYLTPDEEIDLTPYETKTDATTKLDEAKTYADTGDSTTLSSAKSYTDTRLAPIVTSGDGEAYTVTVDGIDELTAGASFIMTPHTVSTTTMPTLNVNNLGAKYIRRRLSSTTGTTVVGSTASWITANKPIPVVYDGTYWIVDLVRPSASDIYGVLPITSGGTGGTSAETALANLGLTAETWTFTLEDGSTVTKVVYVG